MEEAWPPVSYTSLSIYVTCRSNTIAKTSARSSVFQFTICFEMISPVFIFSFSITLSRSNVAMALPFWYFHATILLWPGGKKRHWSPASTATNCTRIWKRRIKTNQAIRKCQSKSYQYGTFCGVGSNFQ